MCDAWMDVVGLRGAQSATTADGCAGDCEDGGDAEGDQQEKDQVGSDGRSRDGAPHAVATLAGETHEK